MRFQAKASAQPTAAALLLESEPLQMTACDSYQPVDKNENYGQNSDEFSWPELQTQLSY